MTGEIDETYLSDLHSRTTDEEQSSFGDFIDESDDDDQIDTSVAVVSDPTGGITDVSDEFIEELGMPENELNNFRSVRASLDIEDDVKRHNRAVEITDLEEKYREYIKSDSGAQSKIKDLSRRVENGENITVVCFEKDPKWCHRHILVEEIEKRINTDQ